MCPTRERREAAYNLLKFSALCYFSKQKNESAVTGLETWALCIQAEAFFFFFNLCWYFPCFLDKNLSENSHVSPAGSLGWRGGALTLHTALPERKSRRWWHPFSSEPLKHFVLGLSKE